MYYYKYCSPGDRQFGMLSRGEFFFASAEELNDGSECRPRYVLKGSNELWNRLCQFILFELWICIVGDEPTPKLYRKELAGLSEPLALALKKRASRRDLDYDQFWSHLLQELAPLLSGIGLTIALRGLNPLMNRVRARVNNLLHENRYMACFSRSPRDPTMWGHYGGAERGFCIIVRAPEHKLRLRSPAKLLPGSRPSPRMPGAIELGIYKDAEVGLESVRYRSAPPRINAFRRLGPHFRYSEREHDCDVPLRLTERAPDRHEKLFGLVKASTWKYEKEVRALLPSNGELTPETRCLELDWEQIQGVILGPKMTSANKKRTIVACHLLRAGRNDSESRNTPFIFLNAHQQVESFQMAISAAGILHGYYTDGSLPFQALRDVDHETADIVRTIANDIEASIKTVQSRTQDQSAH